MAQSAIRAALEAREQVANVEAIKQVRVFSEEGAYEHFIEMRQDPYNPISRETADHSMPYIVASAILDGYIGIDSFDPKRVLAPERRTFVANCIVVKAAPELGKKSDGKLSRASL